MYSPKIAEHLIPRIHRLARTRGQHMTTLVNEVLAAYLANHDANHAVAAAQVDAPGQPGPTTAGTDGARPRIPQFS